MAYVFGAHAGRAKEIQARIELAGQHPEPPRSIVSDEIRKAEEIRSAAINQANLIRAEATLQAAQILADATRKAADIKAAATRSANRMHTKTECQITPHEPTLYEKLIHERYGRSLR